MYRRLILFIIALSAILSSSAASPPPHANSIAESNGVVKELDVDGLKKLLARNSKNPRPLLINFWATWCDACREEFPDLVNIQTNYGPRGMEMAFVSLDDPSDINTIVLQFLREMRAEKIPNYLLNVPDPEPAIRAVDTAWKGALPATFLFDAQGRIVFKHTGRIDADELRSAIDKVVK
jgi:thiol-disulfide isomerase/thioredoxin